MLSDQTSSCSHQVHGVLVFECTVRSLCLFVVRNNSSCPFLLFFFFFFFCMETKMAEWLWTFHFFVFGLSTLILYSGTNCVLCLNILKDNRCFSYFSWFVFCCKCCKTVDKTVYNLLRQPFLGRLKCRARFCKGFAVLTFLIHACCSYNLNNKTCCWQMFLWLAHS